jgi:hypothetical protein
MPQPHTCYMSCPSCLQFTNITNYKLAPFLTLLPPSLAPSLLHYQHSSKTPGSFLQEHTDTPTNTQYVQALHDKYMLC